MRKSLMFLAASALAMSTSAALAHVIDPDVDKANFKLRADVAKQVSKYTFCLVKAASKCEKKGLNSGVECSLAAGTVSYEMPAGDETAKFLAAIGKCDDKMLLTKKGTDYVGIGCPGDCNTAAQGVQQCADIPAFEASVEGASGLSAPKVQLGALAAVVDLACATDVGGVNTDQARIDCASDQAKLLSKYSQGVFKCQAKCETDVKNKKGNGGVTNAANCQWNDSGADVNFNACVNKVAAKVAPGLNPTISGSVLPLIVQAVNDATDGLYNRSDPTGAPDDSPCGTCGDNVRAGAEECDGTDDAACSGACAADCTCP